MAQKDNQIPDLSIFEAQEIERGPTCKVKVALDTLPPDQSEKLRAALASTHSTAAIARVVASWGFKMSSDTIRRHRRRECACKQ